MVVVVQSSHLVMLTKFGGHNPWEWDFTGAYKFNLTDFKSDSVGGYRVDGKSSIIRLRRT